MKKIIIGIGVGLVVLVIIGLLAVYFFLDAGVKRAVETVGPRLTQTEVKLDSVNLSPFSGAGRLKGLTVANPEGFTTAHAIAVGSASLAIKPGSLFGDKIVINSINLESPAITFEGSLKGNNLQKLRENIEAATVSTNAVPEDSTEEKAARKLQVDEFIITDAKLNVSIAELGGQVYPITLSRIELRDLGQGPDGITSAELTERVMKEVEAQALEAARKLVNELAKGRLGEELNKAVGTNASGVIRGGLENLLKKQ